MAEQITEARMFAALSATNEAILRTGSQEELYQRVCDAAVYGGKFKKTGKSFSAAFAHVWTVRGDKLARFDMHTDTAKVLEAVNA